MNEPIETAEAYRARIARGSLDRFACFAALSIMTFLGAVLVLIIKDPAPHPSTAAALCIWSVIWILLCVGTIGWIGSRPATKLEEAAQLQVEIYAARQAMLELERQREAILHPRN